MWIIGSSMIHSKFINSSPWSNPLVGSLAVCGTFMAQTRQKPNRSLSETQTSPCNDLWAWCWSGVLGDVWGKNNMLATLRILETRWARHFFVKRNPLHKWNWSNLYVGILFWGRGRDECWTWRMALRRVLKVNGCNGCQWMPCKENTAQMLFV